MTDHSNWRLWQPPSETIEAIAAVLRTHWRTAKMHPERLFWPDAAAWLHPQALPCTPAQLTRPTGR